MVTIYQDSSFKQCKGGVFSPLQSIITLPHMQVFYLHDCLWDVTNKWLVNSEKQQ